MSLRSTVSKPSRRPAIGLAVVAGALAFTVAACGGGTTSSGSASTTPTSAASGGSGGGQQSFPGAFGTAAAVNASSVEVQNTSSGQTTVNWTSSTTFTNDVSATLADVKTGLCVQVTGKSSGTAAVTATSVAISTPTSSGCTRAGGFGGGGTRPSGSPRPSGSARPSGTRPSGANGAGGGFGGAFGSVTGVTGSTITVQATRNGTATTTTVTVGATTTYTQSESATSSALAVGDCVEALGKADDTGAIAATSITVSKAGPNGCSTGFGGRGRGGAGGGSGTSNG